MTDERKPRSKRARAGIVDSGEGVAILPAKETPPMQTQTTPKKGPGRPTTRPLEERSIFERWIDASGLTRAEVADRLGVSREALFALLGGRRVPSLQTAVAIERLTGGAVPPRLWVPEQ